MIRPAMQRGKRVEITGAQGGEAARVAIRAADEIEQADHLSVFALGEVLHHLIYRHLADLIVEQAGQAAPITVAIRAAVSSSFAANSKASHSSS